MDKAIEKRAIKQATSTNRREDKKQIKPPALIGEAKARKASLVLKLCHGQRDQASETPRSERAGLAEWALGSKWLGSPCSSATNWLCTPGKVTQPF